MVSQPAFTVTLTKEGVPQKLAFRCELINDAMEEDASGKCPLIWQCLTTFSSHASAMTYQFSTVTQILF